jgi:hypothetical protein
MNPPPSNFGEKQPITLDVGPKIRLSFTNLAGTLLVAVGVVGAAGWFIVGAVDTARQPAVGRACVAVALAQLAGLLFLRPWKARHLGRWPLAWLAARGIATVSLLVFGALLYFPSPSDPLVFGLVAVSAYFVSLLAEVAAYAAEVKANTGPTPRRGA